jgi:hypothetical protein
MIINHTGHVGTVYALAVLNTPKPRLFSASYDTTIIVCYLILFLRVTALMYLAGVVSGHVPAYADLEPPSEQCERPGHPARPPAVRSCRQFNQGMHCIH